MINQIFSQGFSIRFRRIIKYSRYTLKYAQAGMEVLEAATDGSKEAWQNAKDTAVAVSESLLRDLLYESTPEKIFDLEINPRDLALFVLNRGHQQSTENVVKSAVYAYLYALNKSNSMSEDATSDLRFCAQLFFSGPVIWR